MRTDQLRGADLFATDLEDVRNHVALRSTASSHALHTRLAQTNEGQCLLLFSPELRQLNSASAFEDELALRKKTLISLPTASFPDETTWPWVTTLDTSRPTDSYFLQQSLRDGLEELQPNLIGQGLGRRNAGWLASQASPAQVACHIASLLIQRMPGGQKLYVRWTDPAVLWAVWPALTPEQQAFVMGPIKEWWLQDPAGNLIKLAPKPSTRPSQKLALTPAQWDDLHDIQALNRAINIYLSEHPALHTLSAEIMAALATRALEAMRQVRSQAIGGVPQLDDVAFEAMANMLESERSLGAAPTKPRSATHNPDTLSAQ